MRAVLQRVSWAKCEVEGRVTGEVGQGLTVFLGVAPEDTPEAARRLAAKIARLRIFSDEQGKMNRSALDVGGSVLSISQFTLLCRHLTRPSPQLYGGRQARSGARLYAEFNAALRAESLRVEEGVFGADMAISLLNDGPVTIVLDV